MRKNENLRFVGDNIRRYRKRCGFTQEKLAVRTNMRDQYISMIENGQINITLDTLFKIGIALEVAPHKFLIPPKKKKGA